MTNVEIAKREGATHQGALDEVTFYKEQTCPQETHIGKVVDGEFTGWKFWSTYPPEWAKII
jgi:hypothetical protein